MSRGEDLRRLMLDSFGTDYSMTDEQLQEFGDRAVEAALLMRRSWREVALEIVRAVHEAERCRPARSADIPHVPGTQR